MPAPSSFHQHLTVSLARVAEGIEEFKYLVKVGRNLEVKGSSGHFRWSDGLLHCCIWPKSSWDALMKKVKAEPELLTDFDKHLNIKKGMRGSISVVSKRFQKQYLRRWFVPKQARHSSNMMTRTIYVAGNEQAAKNLRTEASKRGTDPRKGKGRQVRLDFGGGSRISRGAPRRAQQLSNCTEERSIKACHHNKKSWRGKEAVSQGCWLVVDVARQESRENKI